jgi:hypothetical protein
MKVKAAVVQAAAKKAAVGAANIVQSPTEQI